MFCRMGILGRFFCCWDSRCLDAHTLRNPSMMFSRSDVKCTRGIVMFAIISLASPCLSGQTNIGQPRFVQLKSNAHDAGPKVVWCVNHIGGKPDPDIGCEQIKGIYLEVREIQQQEITQLRGVYLKTRNLVGREPRRAARALIRKSEMDVSCRTQARLTILRIKICKARGARSAVSKSLLSVIDDYIAYESTSRRSTESPFSNQMNPSHDAEKYQHKLSEDEVRFKRIFRSHCHANIHRPSAI